MSISLHKFSAWAGLLGLAFAAPAAVAQTSLAGGPDGGMVHVNVGTGQVQNLALARGKSAIIELPVDARDVLVTNPAVADAVLRTPRRIYILGVASGQTDAVFFDGMGRKILSLDIRVDQDVRAMSETIARVLPTSRIRVEAVNSSVLLTGQVASADESDKAMKIAQQFTAKPEQVVNMLSIAGKDQVMLKVRVVEVQRSAIKQLGFNLNALIGQLGGNQFTFARTPTFGVNGSLLGGLNGGFLRDTTKQPVLTVPCSPGVNGTCYQLFDGPQSGISNWQTATPIDTAGNGAVTMASGMIQDFERVGLVRTLAEPNLTAVSGEAAKFLVGGEFPVPTGQDQTGRVTIEFKPFGVGLGFTPVVLNDGRISLKLSTEVSELSNEGAFTLSNGNGAPGLTIPALSVRRAETTIELPSGGAMMIAGLLQSKSKEALDSIPGMMNLPVLGALFRSRDYQNGETELVIIVTPYLVGPTSPANLQTPADGLQLASDAQTILMGKLNKSTKAPPQATAGRTYQGPYGYVIE
jgi:pilus assembly protein CpaC